MLILCDLEGNSRREAARNLAMPEGTVSSRLATARRMLAERLTRRGIALSAGALATLIGQDLAAVEVPAPLHRSTVRAGVATASGSGAEVVSADVLTLTEGVLKTMLISKLKAMFAFLLAFALFTGGLISLVDFSSTVHATDVKKDEPKNTTDPPKKTDGSAPKTVDPKLEKKTPKADPPAPPDGLQPLKDRLKKHEQDIAKIRLLMLSEIDAEIAKVEAAIKVAQVEQKKGDRTAFQRSAQLTGEKMRLKSFRFQVEHGVHVGGASFKTAALPLDTQIGLYLTSLSMTLRQQLGLAKDVGLVIDKVADKSLASKAGLKPHDIVVQFDGKPAPSDVAAFRKLLAAVPAGTSVDVVVLRQGKQETLKGLMLPPASAK